MILKVILEGIGLGVLLILVCAIGIRKGAVGMVHLYSKEVQEQMCIRDSKLSVLTLLEIPVPCSRLQNSMRDIGYHLCYKNATKAKRIFKKVSKMLWYT